MTNDTTAQNGAAMPSDTEILALACELGIRTRTGAGAIKLTRATLARWGAPQQSEPVRVPLTEEQLRTMWRSSNFRGNGGQIDWFIEGFRSAEQTHGITGKAEGSQQ